MIHKRYSIARFRWEENNIEQAYAEFMGKQGLSLLPKNKNKRKY